MTTNPQLRNVSSLQEWRTSRPEECDVALIPGPINRTGKKPYRISHMYLWRDGGPVWIDTVVCSVDEESA